MACKVKVLGSLLISLHTDSVRQGLQKEQLFEEELGKILLPPPTLVVKCICRSDTEELGCLP